MNHKNNLMKGSINTRVIVCLIALCLVFWVWIFTAKTGEGTKSSIDGIVSTMESQWVQVDKLSGSVYVPEVTVDFIKPNEKVVLRAIFVTDFGDYWGDAHTLMMDADKWENQPSVTIQGSRGLKHQGDLAAFKEARVPPIQLWIFDQSSQVSEPLIKLPILN